MNGQDTSAAHSALQYLISRALLEGKLGSTTLTIPMTDLFSEYEGPALQPESAGLVLKVTITTDWAEGNDDEVYITEILESEEDDGLN